MRNGNVDAGFFTSGLPNPSVTDLSTTDDVRVVPLEGEGLATLQDETTYYEEGVVEAGTYDNEEDVTTATFANLLAVSDDLDEETVYELTSTMWENIESIQQTNASAEQITPETAQDSLPIDLHPGAERYYSEQASQ